MSIADQKKTGFDPKASGCATKRFKTDDIGQRGWLRLFLSLRRGPSWWPVPWPQGAGEGTTGGRGGGGVGGGEEGGGGGEAAAVGIDWRQRGMAASTGLGTHSRWQEPVLTVKPPPGEQACLPTPTGEGKGVVVKGGVGGRMRGGSFGEEV